MGVTYGYRSYYFSLIGCGECSVCSGGLLFPFHTMDFTHRSLWGGLLLTLFSLCSLFRVPVPLLWSLPRRLPLREMTAGLKGQERIRHTVWRIPRMTLCSTTPSGHQPRGFMYPWQGERKWTFLKGRFLLCVTLRKHLFIWVCGRSMPSSERRGNSGGVQKQGRQEPQSHKKPYI